MNEDISDEAFDLLKFINNSNRIVTVSELLDKYNSEDKLVKLLSELMSNKLIEEFSEYEKIRRN